MSNSDTTGSSGSILMNFRLPKALKADFQAICQHQHISMTARLNLMVREFVENETGISSAEVATKDGA